MKKKMNKIYLLILFKYQCYKYGIYMVLISNEAQWSFWLLIDYYYLIKESSI